jgi:CBS domain-containing protein
MGIENVLHETKIRHLDLAPLVCVEADDPLREVVDAMRSQRVGCVLVTEDHKLAGIFTERDLLTKIDDNSAEYSRSVREFMTPQPKTLHLDDSFAEAIHLMDEGGYRDIPLVDSEGRLLGRLAVANIIDYLAEHYPQEIFSLPPRAVQDFAEPDGA